jgi:hypothetical protein
MPRAELDRVFNNTAPKRCVVSHLFSIEMGALAMYVDLLSHVLTWNTLLRSQLAILTTVSLSVSRTLPTFALGPQHSRGVRVGKEGERRIAVQPSGDVATEIEIG